ncbi:hypothetical protein HK102_011390 [Quaeritorhiza haematococci]|nr:hypothetical protein HK102_011390 [Quaeritorhiza haematococci]
MTQPNILPAPTPTAVSAPFPPSASSDFSSVFLEFDDADDSPLSDVADMDTDSEVDSVGGLEDLEDENDSPLTDFGDEMDSDSDSETEQRKDGDPSLHPEPSETVVAMEGPKSAAIRIWLPRLGIQNFPAGYKLFTFLGLHYGKGAVEVNRRDHYLYGHPSGQRFRSPNEFRPHLRYLCEGNREAKCGCDLCRVKKRRSSQVSISSSDNSVHNPSKPNVEHKVGFGNGAHVTKSRSASQTTREIRSRSTSSAGPSQFERNPRKEDLKPALCWRKRRGLARRRNTEVNTLQSPSSLSVTEKKAEDDSTPVNASTSLPSPTPSDSLTSSSPPPIPTNDNDSTHLRRSPRRSGTETSKATSPVTPTPSPSKTHPDPWWDGFFSSGSDLSSVDDSDVSSSSDSEEEESEWKFDHGFIARPPSWSLDPSGSSEASSGGSAQVSGMKKGEEEPNLERTNGEKEREDSEPQQWYYAGDFFGSAPPSRPRSRSRSSSPEDVAPIVSIPPSASYGLNPSASYPDYPSHETEGRTKSPMTNEGFDKYDGGDETSTMDIFSSGSDLSDVDDLDDMSSEEGRSDGEVASLTDLFSSGSDLSDVDGEDDLSAASEDDEGFVERGRDKGDKRLNRERNVTTVIGRLSDGAGSLVGVENEGEDNVADGPGVSAVPVAVTDVGKPRTKIARGRRRGVIAGPSEISPRHNHVRRQSPRKRTDPHTVLGLETGNEIANGRKRRHEALESSKSRSPSRSVPSLEIQPVVKRKRGRPRKSEGTGLQNLVRSEGAAGSVSGIEAEGSEVETEIKPEVKRKRGRPRKSEGTGYQTLVQAQETTVSVSGSKAEVGEVETEIKSEVKRKRGRPRKSEATGSQSVIPLQKRKVSVSGLKTEGGGERQLRPRKVGPTESRSPTKSTKASFERSLSKSETGNGIEEGSESEIGMTRKRRRELSESRSPTRSLRSTIPTSGSEPEDEPVRKRQRRAADATTSTHSPTRHSQQQPITTSNAPTRKKPTRHVSDTELSPSQNPSNPNLRPRRRHSHPRIRDASLSRVPGVESHRLTLADLRKRRLDVVPADPGFAEPLLVSHRVWVDGVLPTAAGGVEGGMEEEAVRGRRRRGTKKQVVASALLLQMHVSEGQMEG